MTNSLAAMCFCSVFIACQCSMCESWVECVGFSTLSEHYSTFSHVTVEKLYISTPGWNFSTISVYSVYAGGNNGGKPFGPADKLGLLR